MPVEGTVVDGPVGEPMLGVVPMTLAPPEALDDPRAGATAPGVVTGLGRAPGTVLGIAPGTVLGTAPGTVLGTAPGTAPGVVAPGAAAPLAGAPTCAAAGREES